MNTEKVLVIDDEPDIRELLGITLQRMNISSDSAHDCERGIELLTSRNYFLVLSDMKLPDGSGLDIVRYIQSKKPQTPVAVITAFGNIESAVETLKAGAFDYVSKPINLSMLESLVNTALTMAQKSEKNDETLIGHSEAMQHLRDKIQKLARSQAPVYIHGASGVGKELVARLIHTYGPRAEKPFIAVNCGAIPSELMESEFFGHVKGSFTGAISDKKGLFQAAHGGTLFLDEVAELPIMMQVKLLRAIQEKAVKPVGHTHEMPVDVRVLSASNKDLANEIVEGRFRQDLYYRINVIELCVPPLKERIADIPLLARNIVDKLSSAQGINPVAISKEALQTLKSYDFPGNVRELENILERAMTLSNHQSIETDDLQLPEIGANGNFSENQINNESKISEKGLDKTLEEQEKQIILNALEKTKWNRTSAAKFLGISLRTLRYRLKKFDLD